MNQGVVNHDSGPRWVIEGNVIEENDGAGMMAGVGQQVIGNCLRNNGQYGINAYRSGGLADLVIEGNEISGNNTDDWETQLPGCGCTGGAKFWAVNGADIRDNWVHHNHGAGLWADTNNNDFIVEGNLIEDNEAEGAVLRAVVQPRRQRQHLPPQHAGAGPATRRAGRQLPGRARCTSASRAASRGFPPGPT